MGLNYRPRRRDANHGVISKAFQSFGFSWVDTDKVGEGFPDGIAGGCGMNLLIEIKDGEKEPARKKLREKQQGFHDDWRGMKPILVESVDDVERIVKWARKTGISA